MTTYEQNREKIRPEELRKYAGQWVAFSMDGSQLLAGAETITALEERLAADGQDPEQVALEKIAFEDSELGGAGLV
jgi:Family of unknown function (DUF5678)